MGLTDVQSEVLVFKRLARLSLRARYPDVVRRGLRSMAHDDDGRYAAARLAVVTDRDVLPDPVRVAVLRSPAYAALDDEMGIDDYVDAVAAIYFDALVSNDESAQAELGRPNGKSGERRDSRTDTLLQDDFSTAYD